MSDNSPYNQTQPRYSGPIGGDQQLPNQYGTMQPPVQGERPQHPLANYQFSSDEMRVLKECNSESFFYRSIPFSTMFGFGTHLAVKNGVLSPNPKYGSVPKVVVSVIIGYFLGKVSYQQRCAEKMMQLPNSKLGQILRQRKQGISGALVPNQGLGTPGFGLTPFSSSTTRSEEVYDDSNIRDKGAQSSALDLDTERPSYGLDDSQSFGDLNIQNDVLPLEPSKNIVTYEELRKTNRDNYYKRMQSNAPSVQDSPTIVRVKENPAQINRNDDSQTDQIKSMKKNQYGDAWSQ